MLGREWNALAKTAQNWDDWVWLRQQQQGASEQGCGGLFICAIRFNTLTPFAWSHTLIR